MAILSKTCSPLRPPAQPRAWRLWINVAVAVVCVCAAIAPGKAHTQTLSVYLWLPTLEDDATTTADEVETVLHEILSNATDARHIVGLRGIEAAILDGGFSLPDCLQGIEPCLSPEHALIQTFGATTIVRVHVYGDGSALDVYVQNRDLDTTHAFTAESRDLRRAAYLAVGEVTEAQAFISITSEPSGAEVTFDHEPIGQTPLRETFPIGTYRVGIEAEGYFEHFTTIELRAGDSRSHHADLEPRFAQLVVRSGTPGAYVLVGDSETRFPVNEPFPLDPGRRAVVVMADGYDAHTEIVDLEAGSSGDFRVVLEESTETIRARKRQQILDWPIHLQLGFTAFGHATDARRARGAVYGSRDRVDCVIDADTAACGDPSRVSSVGVEVDMLFAWRAFELGLVGFGYHRMAFQDGRSYTLRNSNNLVTLSGGDTLLIRLPSVGFRALIGHYVAPYGRVGLAYTQERFRGRELGISRDDVSMNRGGLLLESRLGMRGHLNPLVYIFGEANVSPHLAYRAQTRFGATFGIGLNVADVFGLTRAFEGQREEPIEVDLAPSETP